MRMLLPAALAEVGGLDAHIFVCFAAGKDGCVETEIVFIQVRLRATCLRPGHLLW